MPSTLPVSRLIHVGMRPDVATVNISRLPELKDFLPDDSGVDIFVIGKEAYQKKVMNDYRIANEKCTLAKFNYYIAKIEAQEGQTCDFFKSTKTYSEWKPFGGINDQDQRALLDCFIDLLSPGFEKNNKSIMGQILLEISLPLILELDELARMLRFSQNSWGFCVLRIESVLLCYKALFKDQINIFRNRIESDYKTSDTSSDWFFLEKLNTLEVKLSLSLIKKLQIMHGKKEDPRDLFNRFLEKNLKLK